MKPRKRGTLIVSVIISIAVVLSLVIVYLYYNTDILKTNKQAFLKYFAQNSKTTNIFKYENLKDLYNKKQNETYNVSGELSGELENGNNYINNTLITIEGNYNNPEKKQEVEANVLYDDINLFNVKYVKNDDKYAVKSDEIVNAYIGARNQDVKKILLKLGFTSKYIGNEIKLSNIIDLINLTEDEKQYLYNNYMPIIDAKILKEDYAKDSNASIEIEGTSYPSKAYGLKLTDTQVYDIQISLLEYLKQDNITLNLILSKVKELRNDDNIELKEITDSINKYINELNNKEKYNSNILTITFYTVDRQLIKTKITYDDFKLDYSYRVLGIEEDLIANVENISYNNDKKDLYIKIKKENAINEVNTNIDFEVKEENNPIKVEISVSNKGSIELNNIKNEYKVSLQKDEKDININYIDTINFEKLSKDILTLDNTNSAMLNDFESQMAKQLVDAIKAKLLEVYQQKIQLISML